MIASLRRRIERWVARPLAKAAVWLALAVAAWAVLAAYIALWVQLPVAAGYVTVYGVGIGCGLLADRPHRLEREIMATQLDEQRAAAVVVERGAGVLAPERQPEPEDDSMVSDGFGSSWMRCGSDCDLEVVRPGKVQCSCDGVLLPALLEPTVFVDRSLDPERWLNQGQRAITERCGCGNPGNVRLPSGAVACFRCDQREQAR